jgi:hypothetical protein
VDESEALALSGDGEILAWEAAGPEGGVGPATRCGLFAISEYIGAPGFPMTLGSWPFLAAVLVLSMKSACSGKCDDVPDVDDSRPSLGEDGAGVGVDLGEADGGPACGFEAEVEPADAAEP